MLAKLTRTVVLSSLLTAAFIATAQAARQAISVFVDGEQVQFGREQPQSVAGRTLVPMRPIFEALGAEVQYEHEFRKITARKGNEEIELTIGEKIARKNGAEITLDVTPTLKNGSTLVPLRFVAEALDAKVTFDAKQARIDIVTDVDPNDQGSNEKKGDGR